MPEQDNEQVVELSGNREITMSEWNKLPKDIQLREATAKKNEDITAKGQNPATQPIFDKVNDFTNRLLMNSGNMYSGGDMGPLGPVMSGKIPVPDAINRAKWGVVGGLTGGLPGAAGMAAVPPQTAGQAVGSGLMSLLGPVLGRMGQGQGWLKNALGRVGSGLGAAGIDYGSQKAMGEQPNVGPLQFGAAGALPLAAGGIGDIISHNVAKSGNMQTALTSLNDFMKNAQAAQARGGSIKEEMDKLATRKMELSQLTNRAKTGDITEQALIDRKLSSLYDEAKNIDQTTEQAKKFGLNAPPRDKSFYEQDQDALKQISQLQKQRSLIADDKDPITGQLKPDYNPESDKYNFTKKMALENVDKQITDINTQMAQRKVQLKRMVDQNSIEGDAISGQQKGLAKDFNTLQAQFDNEKKVLETNPKIRPLFGKGTNFQQFSSALNASDSDTVAALMDHLSTLPNGDQHVKNIRDIMTGNAFKLSYDGKGFGKLDQTIGGTEGPLNYEKIKALYGGGFDGEQHAATYMKIAHDIQKITQPDKGSGVASSLGSLKQYGKLVVEATPLSIVFHMPYHAALATSIAATGATSLVSAGIPKLVDSLMENPKLFNSFHNWVESGATVQALKQEPQLSRWLSNQEKL